MLTNFKKTLFISAIVAGSNVQAEMPECIANLPGQVKNFFYNADDVNFSFRDEKFLDKIKNFGAYGIRALPCAALAALALGGVYLVTRDKSEEDEIVDAQEAIADTEVNTPQTISTDVNKQNEEDLAEERRRRFEAEAKAKKADETIAAFMAAKQKADLEAKQKADLEAKQKEEAEAAKRVTPPTQPGKSQPHSVLRGRSRFVGSDTGRKSRSRSL